MARKEWGLLMETALASCVVSFDTHAFLLYFTAEGVRSRKVGDCRGWLSWTWSLGTPE